ncbi:hypothetical protein [Halalkalibacterium ligniniphilum]|uniref:hypothetical protein n=1 Tax=Halalkalibacterium ligniniphilum TaxID=1134413 RepID=UPI000347B448|nr:hypothetical protein [Halalkalibacterium ligniniphilum]
MKQLGFLVLFVIVVYSAYYDLTIGTLPSYEQLRAAAAVGPSTENSELGIVYQEVVVEPGFTVLSIVEHLHDGPIPATIQEISYDFKRLNNQLEPEEIQAGQTYRFPLYSHP